MEYSLPLQCISIESTAPNEDKNTKKTWRTSRKDINETNNPDVPLQRSKIKQHDHGNPSSLPLFFQW